jgi:hypothetical protein
VVRWKGVGLMIEGSWVRFLAESPLRFSIVEFMWALCSCSLQPEILIIIINNPKSALRCYVKCRLLLTFINSMELIYLIQEDPRSGIYVVHYQIRDSHCVRFPDQVKVQVSELASHSATRFQRHNSSTFTRTCRMSNPWPEGQGNCRFSIQQDRWDSGTFAWFYARIGMTRRESVNHSG